MLVFADNAWQLLAAVLVFIIGFSIALIQRSVFGVSTRLAIALYFWHSFFSMFYFWYSLNNTADSTLYYLNSLNYEDGFGFGTPSIRFISSFLSTGLNFSYGNTFLVFNIFGFIGLLAFASTLQVVTADSKRSIRMFGVLFLFLPGISFWSSAIGKDALTFMAAGLVTWAALDVSRRMPAVVFGAFLYLLPRPHMAGIFLVSFCLALLVSSRVGILKKLALLVVAVPISFFGVQFGLDYVGLGNADSYDDVNDYFESRQGYNLGGGSSVDIAAMSVPMRLFTYALRPLFFDANGALALVVSLENLILLFLILAVVFRRKRTKSSLNNFAFMFYLIFTASALFVLANTTANLGIAIRQKLMFMPMLIVLLFSFWKGASKHAFNAKPQDQ